jgi:2-polyprenyl-3-methyl-5-hydroxy-6-metoxy-1,4-benzoquinol methylase
VLDWGGGNGINTPFKDAEIDILDMAEKPLKCGKRVTEPDPPYDLIVCSNVLEHVSYPVEFLNQIKPWMDRSTVLFMEIPKENREQLVWHEHINRFTDESIRRLLAICGLSIIDYKLFPPPRHGYEAIIMVTCELKEPG